MLYIHLYTKIFSLTVSQEMKYLLELKARAIVSDEVSLDFILFIAFAPKTKELQ